MTRTPRATYHHGDLRSALVEATLALIAEKGVSGVTVAEAARRAEVSTAAPYRHFASRTELLSAAATDAGRRLTAQFRTIVTRVEREAAAAGLDATTTAVETFAALGGGYVEDVLTSGAGFELVLADELQDHPDEERRQVTREMFDLLLWPAIAVTGDPTAAESLLRAFSAVAHGYAYLPQSGFMRGHPTAVEVVRREATDTLRTLAAALTRETARTTPLPRPGKQEADGGDDHPDRPPSTP